jgi:hypothetical protein
MPFNSQYPYMRLKDWTSRANVGTETLQASGNLGTAHITGTTLLSTDYTTHSYQVIPLTSTTAEFTVEGSNDNENWTAITGASFSASTASVLVQGDWYTAYCRAVLTGTAGNCLINEVHKE